MAKAPFGSEFGCRNQIERLRRWWCVLQQWQEALELRVFRSAEQLEDNSLEGGQVGACITQGLDAYIAVWERH